MLVRRCLVLFGGLAIISCSTVGLMAAPLQQEQSADATPVKEFADQYNERFATRKPLVGEMLPNAKGWTTDGLPMELDETRGSYTVLVFGCLT